MIEEIKNIKSGKGELRQFGLTFGIVLGLLGCLFLWRQKEWYYYLIIFSIVSLLLGVFMPTLLKPVQKVWMTLALLIGWCMTRVILSVLFYLVVTPIGLLARLCGKDFLGRKIDSNMNSYWILRKAIEFDRRNYENQF
jgi:hypothetical protein